MLFGPRVIYVDGSGVAAPAPEACELTMVGPLGAAEAANGETEFEPWPTDFADGFPNALFCGAAD